MKIIKILFIVIACAIILLPALTLDIRKTYSETENRTLAAFPSPIDANGEFNTQFFSKFESWVADHSGFRDKMMLMYSYIMVKGFGLSSSDSVSFGTDGWMFYTNDRNLEVGTGTYKLSEAELEQIAVNQQAISDYYSSIGKEYFLIFTPSKASVYTEYTAGNNKLTETLMDQVTDYLKQNTDVKVINPKQAVIDGKSEGKLYLKTDTHWNQLGSYQAYKEILRQMKDYGVDVGEPVEVTFEETAAKGEFARMLGNDGLLEPESSFTAVWNKNAVMTTSGNAVIDAVAQINSGTTFMSANTYKPEYYRNDNASSDKKCLIYVDSMWLNTRGLPWYFSENFSDFIYTRIRNVDCRLDRVYDSDVVIFSCVERYIPVLTAMPANIPYLPDPSCEEEVAAMNCQEFPQFDKWTGKKGFCIDGETANGLSISSLTSNGLCKFSGWAVDFPENSAPTDVYVRIGQDIYRAAFGKERPGVVKVFGYEEMRYSGFEIKISPEDLAAGDTVQFIMVNRNTGVTYQPAEYVLIE